MTALPTAPLVGLELQDHCVLRHALGEQIVYVRALTRVIR